MNGFFFLKPCFFRCFAGKSLLCLIVLSLLPACRTGWNELDNYIQAEPLAQTQPVLKKTQKQAQQAVKPLQPPPGVAASRLENQPWPPGMGRPLREGGETQTALAVRPAQSSATPHPFADSPANGKIKVALLLPLSGKNAPLGQAMLNAAQLAVFDAAPQNFELMPRDTGNNAENAARDAIASGARLLIGPVFAAEVAAVKPVVQSSNVNMLALSTDTSLAEPGVYVLGFSPTAQVERVVTYASSQGIRRFAALVPGTSYGKLVLNAFKDAVQKNGGSIISVEKPANVSALLAKRDQIEALFLPLGGEELQQTVSALVSGGLDLKKTRLLGTGLWDEAGIGSRIEALAGGWYAASEPDVRRDFINNYKNIYGGEPPRLATLTYDATALASVLAKRGGVYDRAALTNPGGFAGFDGIFRLTWGGLAERGLAINEITPEGSKVIDPAPSTFAGIDNLFY